MRQTSTIRHSSRALIWVATLGGIIAGLALLPIPGSGQGLPDGGELSLDEALGIARLHNPALRQFVNDGPAADWSVRSAYGQFLPSASVNGALAYEGAGTQTFGSLISQGSTDFGRSSYALDVRYSLSAQTFAGLSGSKADRDATYSRIDAAEFVMESSVTRQYLAALRARDAVLVAERQLERAEQNLDVTTARVEAGVALPTDRKQAEVDRGRAQISILRAESDLRAEKSRLAEQLGVEVTSDFELTSEFEIFDPSVTRDSLVAMALEGHPTLRAYRASEDARSADVWTARSAYFPSLDLFARWSGFTRKALNDDYLVQQAQGSAQSQFESCSLLNQISDGLTSPLPGYPQDCGQFMLTDDEIRQILERNDVWPFSFTKSPLYVQAQISIPIFQGFSRQRQVEQAQALADDAFEARRAEELRVRTAVTTAFDSLRTSYTVVEIEERNLQVAEEQLELARERYTLGAASYLELLQGEESLATAERDYLNAVYDFHNNLSSLEAAVGARLLRDVGDGANN